MQVPRSGSPISVAKITGRGLTSIAILVALLWTCIAGERLILQHANAGAAEVMRGMRELRYKTRHLPATSPAPAPKSGPRTAIG